MGVLDEVSPSDVVSATPLGAAVEYTQQFANPDQDPSNPAESGGEFVSDVFVERPADQEDVVDVPGPSLNDVLGPVNLSPEGESDPQGAGNRDPSDAGGFSVSPTTIIRVVILLALIVAVGQLFTFNIGDQTQ